MANFKVLSTSSIFFRELLLLLVPNVSTASAAAELTVTLPPLHSAAQYKATPASVNRCQQVSLTSNLDNVRFLLFVMDEAIDSRF